MDIPQLRNYIPIAGPARREPADGSETDMRVSIGFEPAWYHKRCGIEFTEHWHKDPYSRYKSLEVMKAELVNRFPAASHWDLSQKDDLATISGIFGMLSSVYMVCHWCMLKTDGQTWYLKRSPHSKNWNNSILTDYFNPILSKNFSVKWTLLHLNGERFTDT